MSQFSNILFVADSTADNTAALTQAVKLAHNNQASLTLVDVVDAIPAELRMTISMLSPMEIFDIAATKKRKQLKQIIEMTGDNDLAIESKVLIGKPFVEIIREVLLQKRDLIIKEVDEKQGIGQQLFGGTDLNLLRNCPCPVWLIKSVHQKGYRKIVAALDYEPGNEENDALNKQILDIATAQALANNCELHIVHAWRLKQEFSILALRYGKPDSKADTNTKDEENIRRSWLEDVVNKCSAGLEEKALADLKPQFHLLNGNPQNVVPECAKELGADLVVMGTLGRTGIPGFIIGNTAEAILNRIDCSVLAIKPPGFVSPVVP